MKFFLKITSFILSGLLATNLAAQTPWLWAESIDRSNTWNEPFYKPYNTADKLLSYRADSAAYCNDCSLTNILWKGIEANKISIYQTDKKGKLSIQKTSTVTNKLMQQLTADGPVESIHDVLKVSEIVIYRKPDTSSNTNLSSSQIAWIALQISFERDTISLYLKFSECLTHLKSNNCKWVHPLNHHIRLSTADALIKRNYIIRTFNIVSTTNLNVLPNYTSTLPPLAQVLSKADTHTSKGSLEVNTDTLLIRLQAICSADITSDYNRGFNKVHLIEYLLKLHTENKIKGYAYHEAGYFTIIQPKDLRNHLLVETIEDGDITIKRFPSTSLTELHTLKTYTKISTTDRITNDWLIFGLSKELSASFNNSYAIAFTYEDVLAALSTTNMMLYNGKNERDSMRLDEALRKQYIRYHKTIVYSVYGDTITSIRSIPHGDIWWLYEDPLSIPLCSYATSFLKDLSQVKRPIERIESNIAVKTYQLNYSFTSENNSALTKNTLLIDALLDAIRTNNITVYSDPGLTQLSTSTSVLNKLDKTRFYKTGNARKDSIYISKIPVEDRFIKSSDLKEFTLSSNYTTIKKKSVNQGQSFGIFIPAEFNPQYETDTLCYVSFNAFVNFLAKNKSYKKLSAQFAALLNEHAIVSVEDFYDLVVYDVTDETAKVSGDLPTFVRERCVSKD